MSVQNRLWRPLALSLFLLTSATSLAQNAVPTLDVSNDFSRHVVIAQGTPDVYQGHPYLLKTPDDDLFVVWCINHGGAAGPMATSVDGGLTWTRLDDRLPAGYRNHTNCPSIYRLVAADGTERLWVFSSQPFMPRIGSADGGLTWKEYGSLGFPNVMAFSSIVAKHPGVQDGCYVGFYHHRRAADGAILNQEPPTAGRLEVALSETTDGGLTWSSSRTIASVDGKDLCEPFAFWSPDEQEICCLMRENTHRGRSMMMFSRDGGETWSTPQETSWELTGDRHIGAYVGKDRLFIAFRDQALESPTRGHFVGWSGSYEDVKNARPGDYRVKLLHSYAKPWTGDCGYPGVAILSDGVVIALTYIKYKDDENKHSVVATRFKMSELDDLAAKFRAESSSAPKK